VSDATVERIGALVKLVLLFRLVALNVTIFFIVAEPDDANLVLAALLVAALVSYAPLRWWDRLGPHVARRPTYLALDLLLAVTIMLVLGPDSPFFLFTLGTAALAGIVYGKPGAIVFGFLLLAGWYTVLARTGLEDDLRDFEHLATLPLLYPMAAAGGAAVRGLLLRQADTERALLRAERAAVAGAERSRVAREMHDSLGKTLYGISLSATALATRASRSDEELSGQASELAGAAQRAAGEARELIGDLRSDSLDKPLPVAVEEEVERWSRDAGVDAEVHGGSVDLNAAGARYELFCILKEALRNVERHADAEHVKVSVQGDNGCVVLRVADDGVGIGASGDPRSLEPEGHWGLVGMAERAERIGGSINVESAPGEGTAVIVRAPIRDVRTPEAWATVGT
jgi:signal transduction histidine kinase